MADIWERKMKIYFMIHDVDQDGVINDKDFEQFSVQFADKNHADPDVKEKLVKSCREVWQTWTLAAKGDEKQNLTMPVFIESMRLCQERDPEAYKKLLDGIFRNMFALMGFNMDGYLQKDEFREFYKLAGITDLEFVEATFAAIDQDHDGKMSFDEFIAAYMEFLFSQDEKNPFNLFYGPLVQ